MSDTAPESIQRQLSEALPVLRNHLGSSILAIHLFGSAVDGGLKRFSDIDLLVTVATPVCESVKVGLMRDLLSVSAYPGTDEGRRALEVTVVARDEVIPWRHPARREMQFGEWLRDGIAAGVFEPGIADHDLAILLTKVRQCSVALYGPPADEFFDEVPAADLRRALLETLALWKSEEDWVGDERNIVLALVRIWYTAVTGDIAAKDVAAAWALERLPREHCTIVAAARDAYLGLEAPDLAGLSREMAALVIYIESNIEGTTAK